MSDADGYESVADALEAAVDTAERKTILQRAIREANGDPAYPAPNDYVAAVAVTDGAVAIELQTDYREAVRLAETDSLSFELATEDAADPDGHGEFDEITTAIVSALIDKHGCDLRLYCDVADLFDDTPTGTEPVRPPAITTGDVA